MACACRSERPVSYTHLDVYKRQGWFLLTMKKVVYAANIAEGDVGKDESELPLVQKVRQIAEAEGSEVLVICAKAEEEIAQLDPEDKQMFLEDMGLEKSGLDPVSYTHLDVYKRQVVCTGADVGAATGAIVGADVDAGAPMAVRPSLERGASSL